MRLIYQVFGSLLAAAADSDPDSLAKNADFFLFAGEMHVAKTDRDHAPRRARRKLKTKKIKMILTMSIFWTKKIMHKNIYSTGLNEGKKGPRSGWDIHSKIRCVKWYDANLLEKAFFGLVFRLNSTCVEAWSKKRK
jgi:hypothetical protein